MSDYASFLSRFFALLIDWVAMGVLAAIVTFIANFCLVATLGTSSDLVAIIAGLTAFLLFIILAVFQFVYFGYFWSKDGESIGMKLLNMKVVRQNEGDTLSFWRAGFRGTIGYWISGLIFGLGFLWAAFDQNKEAWHDKLFDTWVLKS